MGRGVKRRRKHVCSFSSPLGDTMDAAVFLWIPSHLCFTSSVSLLPPAPGYQAWCSGRGSRQSLEVQMPLGRSIPKGRGLKPGVGHPQGGECETPGWSIPKGGSLKPGVGHPQRGEYETWGGPSPKRGV